MAVVPDLDGNHRVCSFLCRRSYIGERLKEFTAMVHGTEPERQILDNGIAVSE